MDQLDKRREEALVVVSLSTATLIACLSIALALFLGLMVVVGLLMTLCGGFFTIAGFKETGMLLLSVPSLLAGLALIWGAIKLASKLSPGGGTISPESLKNTSDDQTGSAR